MSLGRRNISLNKMDMVLILEGLEEVRATAVRDRSPMGEFKATAAEGTSNHVKTVLSKLEDDLKTEGRDSR